MIKLCYFEYTFQYPLMNRTFFILHRGSVILLIYLKHGAAASDI